MPTIDEIQSQVHEFQGKALDYVKTHQEPLVDYVAKAADTMADTLPEDRPELLAQGIESAVFQATFAKKVIDAEATFVKAVIDAAVKPFKPMAAKRRPVKAA
jgi:hypothetical protein